MANVQASTQAVEALFTQVFRDGDYDLADKILTEDFRFQYPFPGFAPGPEGIKQFSREFHQGFPGFEVEVNDLFGAETASGEAEVSIRWTLRGQHTGPFLGIPPTGNYVTVSAIGVYVGHPPELGGGNLSHEGGAAEGTLKAGWLEMDTLGLLQQLGAVKPLQEVVPNLRF
jgi:SnoaL-like polyketide cyclase